MHWLPLLLLAAPLPRAATRADVAVFIPQLSGLSGLAAFSARAGERSALLRFSTWAPELSPLVPVDPERAASLEAAGFDARGDATVSEVGGGRMACLALKDADAFERRAQQTLKAIGEVDSQSSGGLKRVTATADGRIRAAYALKGRYVCQLEDTANGPALFQEAVARVTQASTPPQWRRALKLPGALYVVTRKGVGAIRGNASGVTLEGDTAELPLPAVVTGMGLGGAGPSGLLYARSQVAPVQVAALSSALVHQVLAACPDCPPADLEAVAAALTPHLTGRVLARVDGVRVQEPLQTPAGRYFAVRHAYLAEVNQADGVRTALHRLASWKNATAVEGGFLLAAKGGGIWVGLHGNTLFVANDADALSKALLLLKAPLTPAAHGASFALDPTLAAAALRQVSLLDVLTSAELAGLFAASTELGPLLSITDRVVGWADGGGAQPHHVSLTWHLAD